MIPKVLDGVEVRTLSRPSSSTLGPHCMPRGIVMLKQKGFSPNYCYKVGSTELSKISLH
uniref:Uncharacterized protein n=1 Tax=Anguilla anguilla TaxID=7936 RepID=A0A0E9QA89_ANGAN